MSGSLRQPPSQVHPFPLAQHAGSWLISAFISLCSSWVWKCTHLISAILECEIKHSSVWAPALVTQVFNWSLKNLVSYMRVSPIRKGSSKTWYSLCWCFPLSERGWDLLCPTPTYLGIISEEIRSSLFWGQFVLIIVCMDAWQIWLWRLWQKLVWAKWLRYYGNHYSPIDLNHCFRDYCGWACHISHIGLSENKLVYVTLKHSFWRRLFWKCTQGIQKSFFPSSTSTFCRQGLSVWRQKGRMATLSL